MNSEPNPTSKYCTKCGNKLDVSAAFCTNCGARQASSPDIGPAPGPQIDKPAVAAPAARPTPSPGPPAPVVEPRHAPPAEPRKSPEAVLLQLQQEKAIPRDYRPRFDAILAEVRANRAEEAAAMIEETVEQLRYDNFSDIADKWMRAADEIRTGATQPEQSYSVSTPAVTDEYSGSSYTSTPSPMAAQPPRPQGPPPPQPQVSPPGGSVAQPMQPRPAAQAADQPSFDTLPEEILTRTSWVFLRTCILGQLIALPVSILAGSIMLWAISPLIQWFVASFTWLWMFGIAYSREVQNFQYVDTWMKYTWAKRSPSTGCAAVLGKLIGHSLNVAMPMLKGLFSSWSATGFSFSRPSVRVFSYAVGLYLLPLVLFVGIDLSSSVVGSIQEAHLKGAVALFNEGSSHYQKNEYDDAIADYTAAIARGLNDPAVYVNRGLAYSVQHESDLAIADFSKAIEINKNYALAYASRGSEYMLKGDKVSARADLQRAHDLDPNGEIGQKAQKILTELGSP
jgi:hypothetical protein